ncbi:MAG: TIGR00730 family Rossman fold protein [Candidatus Saccharibacteria bacterium]|nr:TIGR00730 family Rossman fold protein [Candidatus Saccharibacteria bacterium]
MDENITKWLEDIAEGKLNEEDVDRSLRYAKDLEQGLAKIRTFSQGVAIFGSARLPQDGKWCQLARKLGYLLAQNGHPVITGGGPSIMEAANRGAYEAGGRSIGLNIKLPHEQHINPYVTDQMEFRYFFARKVMLTMSSKVYVFFPGGFGTLDEFSEILCLMQENKMPKMPMFLIGKTYWKPIDRWFESKMQKSYKTISPPDRKIYKITDNIEDVVKAANKIGHRSIYDNIYNNKSPEQRVI